MGYTLRRCILTTGFILSMTQLTHAGKKLPDGASPMTFSLRNPNPIVPVSIGTSWFGKQYHVYCDRTKIYFCKLPKSTYCNAIETYCKGTGQYQKVWEVKDMEVIDQGVPRPNHGNGGRYRQIVYYKGKQHDLWFPKQIQWCTFVYRIKRIKDPGYRSTCRRVAWSAGLIGDDLPAVPQKWK